MPDQADLKLGESPAQLAKYSEVLAAGQHRRLPRADDLAAELAERQHSTRPDEATSQAVSAPVYAWQVCVISFVSTTCPVAPPCVEPGPDRGNGEHAWSKGFCGLKGVGQLTELPAPCP